MQDHEDNKARISSPGEQTFLCVRYGLDSKRSLHLDISTLFLDSNEAEMVMPMCAKAAPYC